MEESRFRDKSLRIIGVDPSGAVRQLMKQLMTDAGFKNFEAMSATKDVIRIMEQETIDWIILPISVDEDIHGLQIARLVSISPEIRKTRISLFVSDDEKDLLTPAFELGALSWFTKPFNKDSLAKEIEEFLINFSENQWDSTRLAAHYCYELLKERKNHEGAIDLMHGMLNLYPGELAYLIKIAEPLAALDRKPEAANYLRQATIVSGDQAEQTESAAVEILGENWSEIRDEDKSNEKGNILGLGTCVVIDPDEEASRALQEILERLGVGEVAVFSDGEDAWTWLQANEQPSLIFLEWRIPAVSGPFLAQRIRRKFASVPIIVVSELVDAQDRPLLTEMGISAIVPKPLNEDALIKTVIHTVHQDRVPTEVNNLERKIREHLTTNNEGEAKILIERYKADTSISEARKSTIDAEYAYFKGDYERARNLVADTTRAAKVTVQTLNLLGKTLMKLGDFGSALRCFEKAQDISPMNIHRLCQIAEASAELDNNEDASAAIDAAKDGDADNGEIEEAEARIAVSNGEAEKARAMLEKMDSIGALISYMNNKAVSLARSGHVDKGIDLYEKTLSSIPEKDLDIKAAVSYNLALAQIRHNRQADAEDNLEEIIKLGKSRVLAKSKSLFDRLQKAQQAGKQLVLKAASAPGTQSAQKDSEELGSPNTEGGPAQDGQSVNQIISAETVLSPGDLCCFGIFRDPEGPNEKAAKIVQDLPRFKIRKALVRGGESEDAA